MCGQMARAFGNERFEPPAPFGEVVYIVENHDRGWRLRFQSRPRPRHPRALYHGPHAIKPSRSCTYSAAPQANKLGFASQR
jgi:hypothetical protein